MRECVRERETQESEREAAPVTLIQQPSATPECRREWGEEGGGEGRRRGGGGRGGGYTSPHPLEASPLPLFTSFHNSGGAAPGRASLSAPPRTRPVGRLKHAPGSPWATTTTLVHRLPPTLAQHSSALAWFKNLD